MHRKLGAQGEAAPRARGLGSDLPSAVPLSSAISWVSHSSDSAFEGQSGHAGPEQSFEETGNHWSPCPFTLCIYPLFRSFLSFPFWTSSLPLLPWNGTLRSPAGRPCTKQCLRGLGGLPLAPAQTHVCGGMWQRDAETPSQLYRDPGGLNINPWLAGPLITEAHFH